jgi:hypothetical protein
MKLINAISNIPTVASGGSVTFNLPVGIRYHGFNLYLSSSGSRTAVNSTKLSRVRVLVDTVTLIDWDWPSLLLYAQRRGITLATGQIPIYFTDPLLVGLRNAYAGALDTKNGISNVQVFVQLGTVTAPTLSGELIYDNLKNVRNQGGDMVPYNTPILKYAQVENVPTSSNYSITDINSAYPLDTLTIYDPALSATNITYLTLNLNKIKIFEGTPADIADELKAYGITTPTGTIVLPFTYDRYSPQSAAAFTNIEIQVNCSSGLALGVAVEAQLPSIT